MDGDSLSDLCARQVYDLATDIASEFENVVDLCGLEALNPLVLKVIRVLETLEASVTSLETAERDLAELKSQNLQLQAKKHTSENDKIKLEQDLEELQEYTDKEIAKLKTTILKLRDDNKRLHGSLQEHVSSMKDVPSDKCLIKYLKNTILSLTSKLSEKNSELEELMNTIAKLRSTVEELAEANKTLCCKVCEAQKKVKKLYKDESDLKQEILEQKKLLKIMEESLNEATQQRLDLEESIRMNPGSPTSSLSEMASVSQRSPDKDEGPMQQEIELLLARITLLEDELLYAKEESERFKQQYFQMQIIHSQQKPVVKSSIRQLFHFVLGVVVSENFRCF